MKNTYTFDTVFDTIVTYITRARNSSCACNIRVKCDMCFANSRWTLLWACTWIVASLYGTYHYSQANLSATL